MLGIEVCLGQSVLRAKMYFIFGKYPFKSALPHYAKLQSAFLLDSQCTGEPNTFSIETKS